MYATDLLSGKRIVITGGGTGLGASMALRFAGLGAHPVLLGRRQQPLTDTAATISAATGAPVVTRTCDVRDPVAIDRIFEELWQEQPFDALVNNAAATFIAQTEHLSAKAADAVLATTMHGALYCTLAAGKRWISAARPGVVLSILSTSTITGRAFTVPSSMAKSAVLAMTRSLAVEWGPKNIRCVAIAPGPFPTPGASANLMPDGLPRDTPAQRNPLGRVGDHSELANLAAFLLSDQAGYINGEMVTIDGGAHLRTSGVEDLVRWSDAQWQSLRGMRR